ncbi:HIT zinc finger family protein [Purpureocillium lavendulum]|uniref:HIT zinc finger family protein n=1 Tax=Purpureocillium lavendulum TaxID=1247861 RepID=A0AB34G4L9_9HYPO|nr:HIT zinc finger family protein [Purpureocillium lavendulum]
MNNFGVIELASARTTAAPGWAYVPDTGPAAAIQQPTNRKRARNAPGGNLSIGDLSARQEAKVRKEIEALDRDGARDPTIPLPVKSGRGQAKFTPNVRRIMQSQKTFANHLDDFIALQALTEANPNALGSATRPGVATGPGNGKRPSQAGKRDTASSRQQSAAAATPRDVDTPMADAGPPLPPVLPPPYREPPAAHPGDDDPLLVSRVPDVPSDEELRALLAHPPLTYLEALGQRDGTYPTRVFCEVCGYWGRVRCMKCGTRVCALDCLETHREECVTRYGL